MSDKLSDPTPASPDQSHPTPSPPSIDLQSPDSSFHPLSPSSSLSPSQSRTLGSSQSSPSIRTRPGNGARRNSPTRVGPAMVADLADPAYRLAVSSNTTMREQELSWQWHVYRLATAKQKIDSKPPHSFSMIRDTEKAGLLAKVNSSAAFRQHEIRMANEALVHRIRTQKSTYADNFAFNPNSSSPLVRNHQAKTAEADARFGTNTSRLGGSSGLYFGSKASRAEQRKIQMDNMQLLKSLKRINNSAGPYNKDRAEQEITHHQRLVRRRLPRLMHAHPRSTIENRGVGLQPPIHFSVIAARATSPSKNDPAYQMSGSPSSSSYRKNEPVPDWREYYAEKGLGSSSSTPQLSQAKMVPTVGGQVQYDQQEESKQQQPSNRYSTNSQSQQQPSRTPNNNNNNNNNNSVKSPTRSSPSPSSKYGNVKSPPPKGKLAPIASKSTTKSSPPPQPSYENAPSQPTTREPIDTQEHDYTYDDDGHDDEARTDALLNEFGVEGESLNDGTSNATATENDSPDDILTHEETLSNKLDLQLAHLKRRLNGEEVTIVAEAASNTKEDQQPTAFQFTLFSPSSGPLGRALILPVSVISKLFPNSFSSFFQPPYTDFTSLLYAIQSRFYYDANGLFSIHLEADFKSPPSSRPLTPLHSSAPNVASHTSSRAASRPVSASTQPNSKQLQSPPTTTQTETAAHITTNTTAEPAQPSDDYEEDEYQDTSFAENEPQQEASPPAAVAADEPPQPAEAESPKDTAAAVTSDPYGEEFEQFEPDVNDEETIPEEE